MAFSYLDETNVFKRYTAAKKYTDSLTEPFPEFERIARNRPFEGIDPNYPNTTDGTTASIIRKTPRRVIQQLPTGKVENDAEDWLSVVADFVYTNKIIPYANEEYDLIQKCWTTVESGLTFGFTATYTPFLNHDGYFCPDVTQIYWGDIAVQPGKKSGYSCNYVFMRSWWQKEDIEALIDKEKKLAKSAKERGEKYESTWDLAKLEEIKDGTSTKDQQARTPTEDERGVEASGIELVTGFQKGVGAEFLTFSTKGNIVVRTEKNKDPRGKMPIDWMYGDIDGSNPLGRGIVELIGGLQNLIDSDMQMYQYNRALMLAPPLIKKGSFNKNKVQFVPNAVIDVGSDPGAGVEALAIDTSAVANYPQLYQLQQSQLFNLVQSPQSSISSADAALGQGKTPTALNQQKATVSVDDNYIRKMFEAWWQNWSETAINLYFAKRSGVEELQLDEDTAKRLRKLAAQSKFDKSLLSEDNKIRIDYDTATPALTFNVDASTSKMKDDADQLTALTGLAEAVASNPLLTQIISQYPEKLVGLYNSLVANSGVEDPEELSIDPEDFMQKQEQAKQMAAQQAQLPAQAQPQPAPAQTTMPAQGQIDPEDERLIAQLQQLNVPDAIIQQVKTDLENGMPAEEVIQVLSGANNG